MVMMDTAVRTQLDFSAFLHSFPGNSHHVHDGHCWQDPAKFFHLSPQQKRIQYFTRRLKIAPLYSGQEFCPKIMKSFFVYLLNAKYGTIRDIFKNCTEILEEIQYRVFMLTEEEKLKKVLMIVRILNVISSYHTSSCFFALHKTLAA
jgi:hypothetical protein